MNNQLDKLLNEVETYIADACEMLEKGEYVELKDLDTRVAVLCKEIQALPVIDARQYMESMERTMERLDALQFLMREHQNVMQKQLNNLELNKRASLAYAKPEVVTYDQDFANDNGS